MNAADKGAIAELQACSWLMKQGHKVFRNVSPAGSADIVVDMNGALRRIDIAVASYGKHGIIDTKKSKSSDTVSILYVNKDGSCTWRDEVAFEEIIICSACDTSFTITDRGRKYCSTECSKLMKVLRMKQWRGRKNENS